MATELLSAIRHLLSATCYALFLSGLKNGNAITLAGAYRRLCSTVTSSMTRFPGLACAVSRCASAMYFLRSGDQQLLVAYPTCWPTEETGRLARTVMAGSWGGSPTSVYSRSSPFHSTSSPKNCHAGPRALSASSALRPTKFPLSRLTVHPRPSSNGEDFCASIRACRADW